MPDNTIISNLPVFLGCDAEYEESSICVFGAPFDSTTSLRPCEPIPGVLRPTALIRTGI